MSFRTKFTTLLLSAFFLLTFALNIVVGETHPYSNPNSGKDDGVNVEITSINIDNFPGIHLFVRVTDDSGQHIPDMGALNFEARENGTLLSINVMEEFGYMAACLVMDQSGSMAGWEQDVIDACNYFVDGMDNLDKGAIVKFNQTWWVDVQMTYDKDELYASIAAYWTGGSTALWNAIAMGIDECFYEPEKKAVIAFTDGVDNQPGYWAAQLPGLAGTDITIYTIGIGGTIAVDSLTYVAEATGGFFLPIDDPSQMGQVLNDIREDIGNLYDIYYTTPDPQLNGTVRALEVVCTYQGETGWDTTSYVAPLVSPPDIDLTQSTLNLLGEPQNPGGSVQISCTVRSTNPIENARIYYKTVGQQYFSQDDLNVGVGIYYYYLPTTIVQAPGVEFYLQVADNMGNTVTCPSYNPGYLPLTFPVLPNTAPQITYYAPEIWLHRRSLPIELLIEDDGEVQYASLFYRVPGSFFFYEDPLDYIGDGIYEAFIEGPQLNEEDDLEMFIAAWDDDGLVNYWNLSEIPFELDIVPELPPTPPAVALEPENLPIIIPANGGEFNYTMFVINPIPDSGVCDVWADLQLPDGSIQDLEFLIEDMELSGGEAFIEAYTQEVPDTAEAGDYLFRMHTGDYDTGEEYFLASFPFTKAADILGEGGYNYGWRWYLKDEQPPLDFNQPVLIAGDVPSLSRGWPNPFNSTAHLQFYLPKGGHAEVIIYNVYGEEITRLADGYYLPGTFEVCWNAYNIASGVYFCCLITNNTILTSKLMLVK